ncbi:MAG: hypothetical protein ACRC2T_18040 [Thermoguttaceae bacterium]
MKTACKQLNSIFFRSIIKPPFRLISVLMLCASVAFFSSSNAFLHAQDSDSNQLDIKSVQHALNESLGQGKHVNGWRNFFILTSSFAAIGVIVFALFILEKRYNVFEYKKSYNSPKGLFFELCAAHEFSRKQSKLLEKIAKELQLDNPIQLFIEPSYLVTAIDENLVPKSIVEIRRIYDDLFSDEMVSKTGIVGQDSSWFAWTEIADNPHAAELVREKKPTSNRQVPGVQDSWKPSLIDEINLIASGKTHVTETKYKPTGPKPTESDKPGKKYTSDDSGTATIAYNPSKRV